MSYTRIVQYGNKVEMYEYEKSISTNKRKFTRSKRKHRKGEKRPIRKKYSIARARRNFYRLVHHNNCLATTITFYTLTFAHDVTLREAGRFQADFFKRVANAYPGLSISHISVPEKTKRGRYHFHGLLYDLPSTIVRRERETRNLQRLFRQGYVDFYLATYTSDGLAGYLSKYMAKAFSDRNNETIRGYNASRNIKRYTDSGGSSVAEYADLILPDEFSSKISTEYEVPFLGTCKRTVYTTSGVHADY